MKSRTTLMGLALCLTLVPMNALAAPAKKAAAPAAYQCSKCHMTFSAAVAKKDHFKDPMDGGTLVPVKTTPKAAAKKLAAPKPAHPASDMGSMRM